MKTRHCWNFNRRIKRAPALFPRAILFSLALSSLLSSEPLHAQGLVKVSFPYSPINSSSLP
jgi:hypothetical protein